MDIKKRCIRCNKLLRADGTCQNPNCSKYVPVVEQTENDEANESESEEE